VRDFSPLSGSTWPDLAG